MRATAGNGVGDVIAAVAGEDGEAGPQGKSLERPPAGGVLFRGQGLSAVPLSDHSRSSDGESASAAAAAIAGGRRTSPFNYVPGFLYILGLFVAGKFLFSNPRETLIEWGQYHLSWVEVLMVGAAVVALAEQLKVSNPGIDNTIDAMLMGAVAGLQVLAFSLGAAGVERFRMFNNTEFLMLTFISLSGAIVAVMINARTLRRTIGVGSN